MMKTLDDTYWRQSKAADILIELRKTHRFYIGGGFQMYHVRKIKDFDIVMSSSDFRRLGATKLGKWSTKSNGDRCYTIEADLPIEIFGNSYPRGFAFRDFTYHAPAVLVGSRKWPHRKLTNALLWNDRFTSNEQSVMAWDVWTTILWKEAFGRKKDIADVAKLREWDATQPPFQWG